MQPYDLLTLEICLQLGSVLSGIGGPYHVQEGLSRRHIDHRREYGIAEEAVLLLLLRVFVREWRGRWDGRWLRSA